MTRTRTSARAAGSTFERQQADYWAAHVDDRIDRRVKTGAKDRGDIGGLRVFTHRVVIECKNVVKMSLGSWWTEAQTERGNDDALAALIVHKRHGKGQPGQQWVTTTVDDLIALLTGSRPDVTGLANSGLADTTTPRQPPPGVNNPDLSVLSAVSGGYQGEPRTVINYICPECGACFHLADSFVGHCRDTGHAWEEEDEDESANEPAGGLG